MDNEKVLTQSEKIMMATGENLKPLIEERCRFLGRDDAEECFSDITLRRKMYQSYYHKVRTDEKKSLAKDCIKKSESGLPIEKLSFDKSHISIIGKPEIKVFCTMSEGLLFDNGSKQIPEITLSFNRMAGEGRTSDLLTVREMNSSRVRPIKKSVNSLKADLINKRTEYPDSIEKAVEYLEFNFNSRVAQNFGFEIDASIITRTRFSDLFERAYSGTRLMTTEAYIG